MVELWGVARERLEFRDNSTAPTASTMSSASEDSQLNITLHSGALVYLQLNQSAEDKDDKEPRILFADGFTHSDVRAAPEKHFSFPNALFRVLPKLSYEAQVPVGHSQDPEREKASNRPSR